MEEEDYFITVMPGRIKGLSGSIIGGCNLGINRYFDSNKKEAVVKALLYLTSKEVQRKYIAMNKIYSPLPSMYNDEEVCSTVNCDHYKKVQLIVRPINKTSNYDNYSSKFRKYAYEYLYRDDKVRAIDALKKIDDITRIHYITLDTTDTNVGLILFIVDTSLIVIMLLSLVFLTFKKLRPYYQFLPCDFWILYVLGLVITLGSFYAELGQISSTKCFLKLSLMFIGYTMYITPIICQLIIRFPKEDNKFSKWMSNHRYRFLGMVLAFTFLIVFLMSLSPYTIRNMRNKNEKKFQVCQQQHFIGKCLIVFTYAYLCITIFSVLFLTFLEWNYKPIHYDLRFLTAALYMNIFFYIVYFLISVILKLNDYIVSSIIQETLRVFFVNVNYWVVYGYRCITPLIKQKFEMERKNSEIVNKKLSLLDTYMRQSSLNSKPANTNSRNSYTMISKSRTIQSFRNSLSQKILDIHYITGVENDNGETLSNDSSL